MNRSTVLRLGLTGNHDFIAKKEPVVASETMTQGSRASCKKMPTVIAAFSRVLKNLSLIGHKRLISLAFLIRIWLYIDKIDNTEF